MRLAVFSAPRRFRLDEVDRAFAAAAEKPLGFVKATVTMED